MVDTPDTRAEGDEGTKESAFVRWYRRHKAEFNQKRKDRYRNDAAFRQRKLEADRQARAKAAESRPPAPAKWTRSEAKSKKKSRYLANKVIEVAGERTLLFSSGFLEDSAGISSQTIRQWHVRTVIPVATFTDQIGRRWYSDAYVRALTEAVRLGREASWTNDQLTKHVTDTLGQTGKVTTTS